MLETATQDHAQASRAHDALWAVLWSRGYDDVDEPVWLPDSSYTGVLAIAHAFGDDVLVSGVDTGEHFIVCRGTGAAPPVGSRVRVVPAARDQWRFAEIHPLGLGIALRFDDQTPASGDQTWLGVLRDGIAKLRALLDAKRERLTARGAQLGALSEPAPLEQIWRDEISAITDRVTLQTEYTPQEHAALAKARTRGARSFDEEQSRVHAARKRRYTEAANAEVVRFRENDWPAIRERATAELQKYAEYRTEIVRVEDAMQRIRLLIARTTHAVQMLDAIERTGFRVSGLTFEPERLDDPAYADELLRSVELLYGAVPRRAQSSTTSFSAYRAPTAGPSVTPPRV